MCIRDRGRAKQLIGEDLNLVFIAQVGFHIFFELEQAKVFGVGFGLCMRNANDALDVYKRQLYIIPKKLFPVQFLPPGLRGCLLYTSAARRAS